MKKAGKWLPPILWMGVIFYLSHQSGEELGTWLPFFQRFVPEMAGFDWGHFVAYFVLTLAYYSALDSGRQLLRSKWLAILLSFLYGISDEFHQSFVPGRQPDFMDLRNDTIGAMLAMLAIIALERSKWLKKKGKNTM
jgi:VanZ family protein